MLVMHQYMIDKLHFHDTIPTLKVLSTKNLAWLWLKILYRFAYFDIKLIQNHNNLP